MPGKSQIFSRWTQRSSEGYIRSRKSRNLDTDPAANSTTWGRTSTKPKQLSTSNVLQEKHFITVPTKSSSRDTLFPWMRGATCAARVWIAKPHIFEVITVWPLSHRALSYCGSSEGRSNRGLKSLLSRHLFEIHRQAACGS